MPEEVVEDSAAEAAVETVTEESTDAKEASVEESAAPPEPKKSILGEAGEDEDAAKDDEGGDADKGEKESKDDNGEVEYDLSIPDGLEVDEGLVGSFKDLASKHNLSQDAFNEIASLQVEAARAQVEESQKVFDSWRQETEKMSDVEKGDAKAFVERFGDDDVKALLYNEGIGDNPVVMRLLAKAGAAMREGSPKAGEETQASSGNKLDVLYPTMSKKE